jgi:hypothetical protein
MMSAIFFAIFMAGLAAGSLIKLQRFMIIGKQYFAVQLVLAFFAFLTPLLIKGMFFLSGYGFATGIFTFATIFLLSFGLGYQFQLASTLNQKSFRRAAAENYSADLFGSAIGTYLSALFLIPVLGIVKTSVICGLIMIFGGIFALKNIRLNGD